MYIPSFKCEFCDKPLPTTHCGNEGLVVYCTCDKSLRDWERKHRETIEKRKQAKRGLR